jgi:hypothetical protein
VASRKGIKKGEKRRSKGEGEEERKCFGDEREEGSRWKEARSFFAGVGVRPGFIKQDLKLALLVRLSL